MTTANKTWVRVCFLPQTFQQLLGVRILAGTGQRYLLPALRDLQTGQEERLQKLVAEEVMSSSSAEQREAVPGEGKKSGEGPRK